MNSLNILHSLLLHVANEVYYYNVIYLLTCLTIRQRLELTNCQQTAADGDYQNCSKRLSFYVLLNAFSLFCQLF